MNFITQEELLYLLAIIDETTVKVKDIDTFLTLKNHLIQEVKYLDKQEVVRNNPGDDLVVPLPPGKKALKKDE